MPLARPTGSIKLNIIETPASIPIDNDIAKSVRAILGTSGPTLLIILTSKYIMPVNARIAIPPFIISSGDRVPINFTTATIINIEVDIANNILPTLGISRLAFLAIVTSANTNREKAYANKTPLIISAGVSLFTSFITAMSNNIEIVSFKSIPPTLSIFLPDVFVTSTRMPTNKENAIRKATPLTISLTLNPPMSFTTATSIKRDIDILRSIFPALSIF